MIGQATFINHRMQFDDDLIWRPVNDDPIELAESLNQVTDHVRPFYRPWKGALGQWLFMEVVKDFFGEDAKMVPAPAGPAGQVN